MSAPIPEDLQSVHADAIADGERMSEWRSSFVRELIERIAALETALKFYADRDNHEMDGGKRARAALAATKEKA